MVDPCVFRLTVNDEVVAMLVVQLDDIKIAGTKEITDSFGNGRSQEEIPYEPYWRGCVVHG